MLVTALGAIQPATPALMAFGGNLAAADEAVSLYNAKQYAAALEKFKQRLLKNPRDTKSHYYSALCYQGLNQIKLAQKEYMWVYRNGDDARMKYGAWQALSGIERWSAHRDYQGQGNVFSRGGNGPPAYRPSSVPSVGVVSTGSA